MNLARICESYFQGFQDLRKFNANDLPTNVLALLKVISYFSVIIPVCVGIAYLPSLCGRISHKQMPSIQEHKTSGVAAKILPTNKNKVDPKWESQLTLEPLTPNQSKDIKYIVTTLGNGSLFTITSSQSDLYNVSRNLNNVHPLQFLASIFCDPEQSAAIHALRTRNVTWIWKKFYAGIEGGLKKLDSIGCVERHIDEFAAKVKLNSSLLRPLVANKQWEKFVDTLIENIP